MDLRIGGILKLLGHEIARVRGSNLLCPPNGSWHSFASGGEDEVRSVRTQKHAAFPAHGVGHHKNQFVPSGCSSECQRNAGISAGWLNQDGVGMDHPGFFRGIDHCHANTVFNTMGGIKVFQFGNHGGFTAIGKAI